MRRPCASTTSAAATNGPAPGSARTRAGSATRHTNALRSSARSSSGSSTASPIHQPGATLGSGTLALDPGAASARPTSRLRPAGPPAGPRRTVTDAGVPPGVPATVMARAPSATRAWATPRFASASPLERGASARTRTPRGMSARPWPNVVRWRSLTTATSRPGKGSAFTSRVARATASVRSSRRQPGTTESTVASRPSREPARATPSDSISHKRSPVAARAIAARATRFRRSISGRPSTTAPEEGELSRMSASAVGSWAPPPTAPRDRTSGRAAAMTIRTIRAVRSNSRSRCRSLRRRALCRSASLR